MKLMIYYLKLDKNCYEIKKCEFIVHSNVTVRRICFICRINVATMNKPCTYNCLKC